MIGNIGKEWSAQCDLGLHTECSVTAKLRECDTFQFMVWDTGSGDIDILIVKGNIRNAIRGTLYQPIHVVLSEYSGFDSTM